MGKKVRLFPHTAAFLSIMLVIGYMTVAKMGMLDRGHWGTMAGDKGGVSWGYEAGENSMSRPLIDSDRLYLSDASGTLSVLEVTSGRTIWKERVAPPRNEQDGAGAPTAVLGGGMIFTVSEEGMITALDMTSGRPRWKERVTQVNGSRVGTLLYNNGWIYVPVTYPGETPEKKESGERSVVLAVDSMTGKARWTFDTADGLFPNARLISRLAIDPMNGTLFLVVGRAGNPQQGTVAALNAQTGAVKWAKVLGGS